MLITPEQGYHPEAQIYLTKQAQAAGELEVERLRLSAVSKAVAHNVTWITLHYRGYPRPLHTEILEMDCDSSVLESLTPGQRITRISSKRSYHNLQLNGQEVFVSAAVIAGKKILFCSGGFDYEKYRLEHMRARLPER